MGIESGGFECRAAVVSEEGIEEGEECVDRIERGSACAPLKSECSLRGGCDEVVEGCEIRCGRVTLKATHGVEGGGVLKELETEREKVGGVKEGHGSIRRFLAVVTCCAAKESAGIGELGTDEIAGDGN